MPNQQLIDYIKQAQTAKQTEEQIRTALLNAGWPEKDVNDALASLFSTAQLTIVNTSKFNKPIIIVTFLVTVLFIVSGGFAYYFYVYKPAQQEQVKAEPQGQSQINQVAEELFIEDCGVSRIFAGDELLDKTDFDADHTMICLGKNLLNNCQKSHAIIETSDIGKINYDINGLQGSDCMIKMIYGSADQIPEKEQKMWANTFFECPVNTNEILASLGTKNPQDYAGRIAGTVYDYIGFQFLSSESKCKTGTIGDSTTQEANLYGVMINTISGKDNMSVAYDTRGKKITFTFTIINTGIKEDKYQLDITSLSGWELSVDGWKNEKKRAIELKPQQSYLLQVWVLIPSEAEKGSKEEIRLEAKSMSDKLIQETSKMSLEVQ